MADRVRVYEIANDLGLDLKVVLSALTDLGERVNGPSSTLQPPVARRVREALRSSPKNQPTTPSSHPPIPADGEPGNKEARDSTGHLLPQEGGLTFAQCPHCLKPRALLRNGQLSIHFVDGAKCLGSGDPTAAPAPQPRKSRSAVRSPGFQVSAEVDLERQARKSQRMELAPPTTTVSADGKPAADKRPAPKRAPKPASGSIIAVSNRLNVSYVHLISVIYHQIKPGMLLGKSSEIEPDIYNKLLEFVKANPALLPPRPVEQVKEIAAVRLGKARPVKPTAGLPKGTGAAPAKTSRRENAGVKTAKQSVVSRTKKTVQPKRPPMKAAKQAKATKLIPISEGLPKCSRCGAKVSLGLATRSVILHDVSPGVPCSGSGRPPAKQPPTAPIASDLKVKKNNNGDSEIDHPSKTKNRSRPRGSGGALPLHLAKHYDEYGGYSSVRTVRGGLPGQGRRT